MRLFGFIITGLLLMGVAAQAQTTRPLTLDECIQIALKNNVQIRISKYQYLNAQYDRRNAYRNILPTFSISMGVFRYERGPTSYLGNEYVGPGFPQLDRVVQSTDYSMGLTLNQNIYDGGMWWNTIRKGKVDERSQAYNYEAQRQQVIVTVMQNYFTLLKEIKLLEVNRQAVERSREQLERAESMYELGSVAKVDVFKARVNLGNDRIQYINQENRVRKARQDLNIAMGRNPDEPLEIATDIEFTRHIVTLDSLYQVAMHHNPTLRKYQLDRRSADLQIKIAGSRYFPEISGFFSLNRRVPQFDGVFKEFDREYNYTVGIQLRWTLFNGFADYIQKQKAKVNAMILQEQQTDYQRNLMSTIKSLYDNLKAYDEIIRINRENLEAAREEYRLALERYRIGNGTAIELREAQVNLTRAEQVLVSTEYDAIITYAQLQEAVGKLSDTYVGE